MPPANVNNCAGETDHPIVGAPGTTSFPDHRRKSATPHPTFAWTGTEAGVALRDDVSLSYDSDEFAQIECGADKTLSNRERAACNRAPPIAPAMP